MHKCKLSVNFAGKISNMKTQDQWNICIKRYLKAEMVKKGITNDELSKILNNKGLEYSRSSIESKICRGKFSASFFIQCLSALSCKSIDIEQIVPDEK